jgi:ribosomal protein S18 acetylase RimI-like enzyme
MAEIIRLNRRHLKQLAKIDYESEHQVGRQRKVTLKEYEKEDRERFDKGHEIFFGYKEDGVLKGYVTLKPFFPGYHHCEVYWLAVSKFFQRQGIGTKLMRFIENYAKKKKFRKVCLYTNKTMKHSRRFYEKNDYKLINEFKGFYGYKTGNTTSVLYCKNL